MTAGYVPKDNIIIVLSKNEARFMKDLFEKADNGMLKEIYKKIDRALKEFDIQ